MSQSLSETVLRIDGRICAEDLEILRAEVEVFLKRKRGDCLVLDVDEVPFIDEAGIALLRSWPPERVVLWGGSFYLRTLLESRGLVRPGGTRGRDRG